MGHVTRRGSKWQGRGDLHRGMWIDPEAGRETFQESPSGG
jgi:hypothetical protein